MRRERFANFWQQLREDTQRVVRDLETSFQPRGGSQAGGQAPQDRQDRQERHLLDRDVDPRHPGSYPPVSSPSIYYHPESQQYHVPGTHLDQQAFYAAQGSGQYFPGTEQPHQPSTNQAQLHQSYSRPENRPQRPLVNGSPYSNGYGTSINMFSPMTNSVRRPQQGSQEQANAPPQWVAPPDHGHKTAKLRQKLSEEYGLSLQLVQQALDYSETEMYAELYCAAYILIGGSMKDALIQANLHGDSQDKLVEAFGDPKKGLKGKELTPSQVKAKEDLLARLEARQQAELVDAEDLEEDEMERLREEVEGLPLEDALRLLGVGGPGFGLRDVQRELFPGNGISTRTREENARRSAAYNVALEVLENHE